MKYDPTQIIGEVVAEDYRAAKVFRKYNIDFCCTGNRRIEEATAELDLDVDVVIEELDAIHSQNDSKDIDYRTWPLDFLADYIEKTHHRNTEKAIPILQGYLAKINRVHGSRHPELNEVLEIFNESAGELSAHMKKEELTLFPLIRKIATGKSIDGRTVSAPIKAMMDEHENEGENFRRIAELTNDYTPPIDACNTYRVAFGLLKEFEEDLHKHIHLENNILFPESIKLEEGQPA